MIGRCSCRPLGHQWKTTSSGAAAMGISHHVCPQYSSNGTCPCELCSPPSGKDDSVMEISVPQKPCVDHLPLVLISGLIHLHWLIFLLMKQSYRRDGWLAPTKVFPTKPEALLKTIQFATEKCQMAESIRES